ncbi:MULTISPECIES: sensor histidine kinase [Aerococcus]|uniref:histidine kinase n=1 Tax=Aerococcus tenax TaxID=3078812 RepID=A0A5N1BLX0_9LACT|nr:HAMP domain-containing sensor histidine kinase [Aerococcus urinae]KAA9241085.1 HAMP domain-containing histidine kinase [Aerococcus urinae]MDK6597935.1 HAMP domain-containing sensor histidine kinase [Aerococcus urinae]MDK7801511.1 HAMP domain-containing sensor histidine kinase [Aerococcus urinae]MDK8654949.1 HAMP domain-containing sensor histidine kinase [Aerococcus urinae]
MPAKRRLRIFTELLFETIAVTALLVIGYFGMVFVFITLTDYFMPLVAQENPYWLLFFPRFQRYFVLGFTAFYLMAGLMILIWRVYRRNRTIQLGFILDELHYISKGNYNHKISTKHMNSMEPVVSSINRLVDSTVKAMEEERRIEESKDELIANMSHDIRTPLTSVIGYLGLIENKQIDDPEKIQEYVHIAYDKALQMQKMVEDLFEYTKIQNINTKINTQKTNVVRLLEQLNAEFELQADEVGRRIEVDSSGQEDIWVEIDPETIVRLFSNLITNAIKYGGEGDYILLRVIPQKQRTRFEVIDDGNEISQEALENLFQRFYRVDPSRTTKGSGLGLAIAQTIVNLHHGKIWAESDHGQTRFIFVLPNQQPLDKKKEADKHEDSD